MKSLIANKLKEISFEIIQACPNNCIYCSSNSSINCKHIIKYSVFKRVIDDASTLGLKLLCISGGEPFLHPNLVDMVSYAKKYNIDVNIYTSGITVTDNQRINPIDYRIISELKRFNVDKLIFNMQADDPYIYDKIVGTKNNFSVLKESIRRACDAGIYTEVHFVPMKINYKRIYKVLDLANELQIKKVSFLRFVPQGRARKNIELLNMSELEETELMTILNQLGKRYKNVEIRTGVPLSAITSDKKCNAGRSKLIIKYDGSVYPCEAYKFMRGIDKGREVLPDNINSDSIIDIWQNSEFIKILVDYMLDFECNEDRCESCPARDLIKKSLNDKKENEVLTKCI